MIEGVLRPVLARTEGLKMVLFVFLKAFLAEFPRRKR